MIMISARRGLRSPIGRASPEIGMLILLLAMIAGAVTFSFFISSRDVKSANARSLWTRNIEKLLDKISLEIQNAANIEFPFQGEGNQCIFRRSSADWSLQVGPEIEILSLSESNLAYQIHDASGTNLMKPFQGNANPLLTGIQSGHFERSGPHMMRFSFKIAPPDAPDSPVTFERCIHLRNQ
ncbi:MAG: hypothetical protein HQM09_11930 [Candidatus Riflebacteria bacterium]|nr:hypothetical protein [Candidatus Riflebacteria bacterium]